MSGRAWPFVPSDDHNNSNNSPQDKRTGADDEDRLHNPARCILNILAVKDLSPREENVLIS